MRSRWFRLLLALAGAGAATLMLSPASAQPLGQVQGRTITVIAEGEARAEPDIGFLNAGVEADGATPREALSRVDDQMRAVLAALARAGVAREDIQTSGLNVFSITGPPERSGPGAPPQVVGYRASNSVNITVRDLTRIEAIIDAIVEAGITNLGGISFGVRDTLALHRSALTDAMQQARPLAEAVAQTVGLTLGEVESVEEISGVGGPVPAAQFGGARSAAGPVAPGALTLQVRVQVTFRVAG